MGDLSELINDEERGRLIESIVCEGDVFRMHLDAEEQVKAKNEGDKGRNKYFIVLGHDEEGNAFGFVLINTRINVNLPQRRKELHYALSPDKYDFLGGQRRFVDCSDFKIIEKRKFVRLFSGTAKGRIEEDDLRLIRSAVAEYEDISPMIVRRFGLNK